MDFTNTLTTFGRRQCAVARSTVSSRARLSQRGLAYCFTMRYSSALRNNGNGASRSAHSLEIDK